MSRSLLRFVVALLMLPVSSLALAHGAPTPADGFLAGFRHPLSGLDHLLSLLLAGIVIGRLARRRLALGAGFVGAFLSGLLAGVALGPQAAIDGLLLLGLPVLGFFLWRRTAPGAGLWLALAGIAFLHGFAHGMEGAPRPDWMTGAATGMGLLLTAGMELGRRWLARERGLVAGTPGRPE